MRKQAEIHKESPRTPFQAELAFCKAPSTWPAGLPTRHPAFPQPCTAAEDAQARCGEEGGRERPQQGPRNPQISLPPIRKPSGGSETSPLLRRHRLWGNADPHPRLDISSHTRGQLGQEMSFAECRSSSSAAVHLLWRGESVDKPRLVEMDLRVRASRTQ